MGHARNPKSAVAHSTALSHVSSLSTALVGWTQTPETRPVVMCAYQATNIEPRSRSARMRHRSRHPARFSNCLAGGWTTNRPGRSEGETRVKASSTTSLAVFAERSFPLADVEKDFYASAASGLYIGMQEGAQSGSRHSWLWPPIGLRISPALKFDTTLLYAFIRTVYPALLVRTHVQTWPPTLPVFANIVDSSVHMADARSPCSRKPSEAQRWSTSVSLSRTPEKSCV